MRFCTIAVAQSKREPWSVMWFRSIHLVAVVAMVVVSAGPMTSSNSDGPYRVMRLLPSDDDQLDYLIRMWKNASYYDLDFWQNPTRVNATVDIMVGSKSYPIVDRLFTEQNIRHNITIRDVKKLIEQKQKPKSIRLSERRLNDDAGWSSFNLGVYHSYDEILQYMTDLQRQYPQIAQVFSIGSSHERRPLNIIKIGSASTFAKKAVWIDAGIHAREWIAPTTALYFIQQLVTRYNDDPQIRQYVDELDWYVMPVVNPDGYEFTRTSTDPKIRLWRKNRSPSVCKTSVWGQECCQGVDLNRNFDFHWGETGASDNPCEEIYAGSTAFSEPETKAIQDFLIPRSHVFNGFITLHSYSQIWMYPYGHQRNNYPADVADLQSVALQAKKALQSLYGTKYIVGTGADTLYPASGGSDDWAKQKANIKYVYLIELRPEDNIWDGFILDEGQIMPTAKETWEGIKAVGDALLRFNGVTPSNPNQIVLPTGATETCKDNEAQCRWWATLGGCLMWRDMDKRCPLSCRVCDQTVARRTCSDNRRDCDSWKKSGLCSWVASSCKLTCNFC